MTKSDNTKHKIVSYGEMLYGKSSKNSNILREKRYSTYYVLKSDRELLLSTEKYWSYDMYLIHMTYN